jgi:integrase
VVKLETNAETPRDRRLAEGEEDALLKHASRHLHALIVAALSTGCRLGELLGLQWKDVEAAQHIVRDHLGHANITTTSRYLSSSLKVERADSKVPSGRIPTRLSHRPREER